MSLCDHVGLLHKGGILFSRELDEMKLGIHKLQCAFSTEHTKEDFAPLEVLRFEKRGNLCTLTVRGDEETIMRTVYEKAAAVRGAYPAYARGNFHQ